jgi:hypothetical protein
MTTTTNSPGRVDTAGIGLLGSAEGGEVGIGRAAESHLTGGR